MEEGLPYLSIRPAVSGGFETLLPLTGRLPDIQREEDAPFKANP